jgi:Fe-S-cluster containining protein
VVLNFQEWLTIIKNYGVETTASGLNKLYIKRKSDGSCSFLYNISNTHLCGLQHMKPKACKLWPFKVLNKPEYGYAKEAAYDYKGSRLFVYADSNCSGLKYGRPTWEFTTYTVKEFIEIALGIRNQQIKSTADLGLLQPYVQLRRPNFYYRV